MRNAAASTPSESYHFRLCRIYAEIKDFTFKPGLRYEQTIQEVKYLVGAGENFNSNFSDLVPSVSLGIKLGKTQNLRGGYNMRIWRPGIWNLNPYFDNQDPMFINQGNPNLKSEKSHSFDLSYSSFTAKFNINLSLRHSFNNNGIERVSRLITDKDGEIFKVVIKLLMVLCIARI